MRDSSQSGGSEALWVTRPALSGIVILVSLLAFCHQIPRNAAVMYCHPDNTPDVTQMTGLKLPFGSTSAATSSLGIIRTMVC